MDSDTLRYARRYLKAGLSVIPIKADGSKEPAFSGWRTYSNRQPTHEEIESWWPPDATTGIGVVPGPASLNLVVLDFETEQAFKDWMELVDDGHAGAIDGCPVIRTPSGARHVWVRLAMPALPAPGTVLARDEDGSLLVEVRGYGHQVLAPGCPPECHPARKRYTFESYGWLGE